MGKVLRAVTVLPVGDWSPELKTFYSKQLLDRLVPPMVHAEHGLNEQPLHSEPLPDEIEQATNKWREHFGLTIKVEH